MKLYVNIIINLLNGDMQRSEKCRILPAREELLTHLRPQGKIRSHFLVKTTSDRVALPS